MESRPKHPHNETRMNKMVFLRASYTKRWTIVNTSRTQNIAEHSFNVVNIASRLADIFDWEERFGDSEFLKLQSWALYHDIVEIYTGDMPTPFKRALEESGADILAAEEKFMSGYGDMARDAKGTEYGMIVKFADQLEAIWFLKDHGIGNRAKKVLSGLYDNLYDMVDEYDAQYPDLHVRGAINMIRGEMDI